MTEGRLDLSYDSDGSENSGIFVNKLVPLSMLEAHIAAEDEMVAMNHSYY